MGNPIFNVILSQNKNRHHMKIYPEGLQELIEEDSVTSHFSIPKSFIPFIKDFQKFHQAATDSHKLTREEVLLLMLSKGKNHVDDLLFLYKAQAKEKSK